MADIPVAWLVYIHMYCVPTATLNQNKQSRLLYLGDVQIKLLQISHKYGICSLEMENKLEIQFWYFPGVGHLYPIFKPHCRAFAAFPKQDDKYSTNAWGAGGWARLEYRECNFVRKVVYFVWYIISKQNSPKVVRRCRATRNFLQIYFLTLLHNANVIKAN